MKRQLAEQLIDRKLQEADGDDPSSLVADATSQVTQAISTLKGFQGVGGDKSDLATALRYLEAGVIMLNRVVSRNVQKR
jgi:hypothetical protein